VITDPISLLARKIALRRHESLVESCILPLSEIKRATVFVDSSDPDSDPTRKAVQDFFSSKGISVKIICPQKWDINWHGFLKQYDDSEPDLFISLAYYENFAAEYASRCSTARFKIGRRQLEGNVFDVVIYNPEDQLPLQHVSFEAIRDFLLKVQ